MTINAKPKADETSPEADGIKPQVKVRKQRSAKNQKKATQNPRQLRGEQKQSAEKALAQPSVCDELDNIGI